MYMINGWWGNELLIRAALTVSMFLFILSANNYELHSLYDKCYEKNKQK